MGDKLFPYNKSSPSFSLIPIVGNQQYENDPPLSLSLIIKKREKEREKGDKSTR